MTATASSNRSQDEVAADTSSTNARQYQKTRSLVAEPQREGELQRGRMERHSSDSWEFPPRVTRERSGGMGGALLRCFSHLYPCMNIAMVSRKHFFSHIDVRGGLGTVKMELRDWTEEKYYKPSWTTNKIHRQHPPSCQSSRATSFALR